MSNYSNNDEIKVLFFSILVVLLGIGAWFSKQFGLDFATGFEVAIRFAIFVVLFGAAVYYLVSNSYFRFVSILPVSIAGLLSCGLPAFDYWSNQNFGNIRFDGSVNYAWYATGWIQALIALTIIAGGHGLIRYLDSRNGYW